MHVIYGRVMTPARWRLYDAYVRRHNWLKTIMLGRNWSSQAVSDFLEWERSFIQMVPRDAEKKRPVQGETPGKAGLS